ncbi:MAG: Serine-tRNA ligase [Microgenomates group bacterium GW2011_GWA2_46_7]|nr:MAG: Serine-tRNA ligase [Microgenomates group bacterium GW2011_GWA2_46_7]
MLDIQYIRDNAQLVKTSAKNKNGNPAVVDNLLEVDQKRRELIGKVEVIRGKRNKLNDQLKTTRTAELIAQSKELKLALENLEPELKRLEVSFADLMLQIPNVSLPEVPVGKDESGNVVVREWGTKPQFDFTPLDHVAIATQNDWLDLERGSKVAGYRGYYLKNDAIHQC